tara:strand:+ start:160 stop:516 length:357 start_codon:yes stop_codon:yes gene_type:complete
MSKKPKDRVEILEEQVKKLQSTLRSKDKTIRQLKTQVTTAESAFKKTEIYLKEVTNGKPLSEILKLAEEGKPFTPIGDVCPDCGSHSMKKILFTGFHIITCECGYRNKVDEEQQIREG